MNKRDMTVAMTILDQLGGAGRVQAMLGVTMFLTDPRELSFRFKAKATNGANHVTITLEWSDTYTVTFHRIGRRETVTEIGEVRDVSCDGLRGAFSSATGLALSL